MVHCQHFLKISLKSANSQTTTACHITPFYNLCSLFIVITCSCTFTEVKFIFSGNRIHGQPGKMSSVLHCRQAQQRSGMAECYRKRTFGCSDFFSCLYSRKSRQRILEKRLLCLMCGCMSLILSLWPRSSCLMPVFQGRESTRSWTSSADKEVRSYAGFLCKHDVRGNPFLLFHVKCFNLMSTSRNCVSTYFRLPMLIGFSSFSQLNLTMTPTRTTACVELMVRFKLRR